MGTLILVLLLLAAAPSWARDYYFKQSGSSDSNPCTQDSPCQSIAKAGSLSLKAGDRILFNRGDTFTDTSGNGFDWTSQSGTSANHIVVTAYGTGARPIITKSGNGYGLIIKSSDWIDISSLHISGYQFSIEIRGVRNSTFTDLHLSNPAFTCFHMLSDTANGNRTTQNVTVSQSELDSCGVPLTGSAGNGEGFYIGSNESSDTSGDITLTNNYVHDTTFECLEVKQGTNPSITITNNTFEHCHRNNHTTSNSPGGDSGTGIVATGSSTPNNDVLFRQNWIKDVVGTENDHSGVGARWQRMGMTATHNIVANNQGEGLVLSGGSGTNNYLQTWKNNTFYGNGRECTNIADSATTDIADNICWKNGSGNDASNPQFVAAASNNFNLSTGSPALGTGAENTNKGALQTFAWTSASLLSDGITVRVTGAVNSLFQPLSSGTASAFTLTCSTAGTQSGQTFTPSGSADTLITVAIPIAPGEKCTLAATAGAAQDSANIGGALAPGGPLNSTSLAITGLSVTNGSENWATTQIPGPKRFRIVGETQPDGSMR